ncbi:MAG: toprim domain-containing protein [Chloroflexota bacterium]|nr:toprim domain-containing protein [Chloroflexota bacterium]
MFQAIDTRALKRANPIVPVILRYGIDLRSAGSVLVGRCPFHADGGRPNFTVYPAADAADDSYYCFRCSAGGDVITFVRLMEGSQFPEACSRLAGTELSAWRTSSARRFCQRGRAKPIARRRTVAELACLAAAVELYHNRLLHDSRALGYVVDRGIDRAAIERFRLGFASGHELVAYLRWRHLPLGAAMRAGLIGSRGREALANRVVIPEIRGGQPIWLIGRLIDGGQGPDQTEAPPRYLGLPGHKPLLGWERARRESTAFLTEGPFDWLTLMSWGLPALALVGTNVRPSVVQALTRFDRLYLVLDNDEAGRAAASQFAEALAERAIPVTLPDVKDVSELGERPDGRAQFLSAVDSWQLSEAA